MLTPELEQLMQFAFADGEVSDKERAVLMRKAQEAGVDMDEFEMILDAKIHETKGKMHADESTQKPNSKHGEIRKCPACGAMVSTFATRCSECGFEFKNVEAVKSAQMLFEKLQSLEMEKARELSVHEEHKNKQLQELSARQHSGSAISKMFANSEAQDKERNDLIRTLENDASHIERKYLDAKINMIKVFTVPNTKEDLLELLSMASSSAYDNDGVIGPEEEVWLQKTDQIYQKLVICAAGDNVTLNQATNMIVSLIKRLPKEYKNFTRIPKELRDKINVELKAQKAERKSEFIADVVKIFKGWRGIALAVATVAIIVGSIIKSEGVISFAALVFIVICVLIGKAIKDAKNDLLY